MYSQDTEVFPCVCCYFTFMWTLCSVLGRSESRKSSENGSDDNRSHMVSQLYLQQSSYYQAPVLMQPQVSEESLQEQTHLSCTPVSRGLCASDPPTQRPSWEAYTVGVISAKWVTGVGFFNIETSNKKKNLVTFLIKIWFVGSLWRLLIAVTSVLCIRRLFIAGILIHGIPPTY